MYNLAFRRLTAASALLAFFASTAALAQEQTQTHRNGAFRACRDDRARLCSGVQLGGGRILACLQSHASDVSPDCKAVLAKVAELRPPPN